ncbi:conserved hypothetical protein [Trichinella spiralis]|uniref:hypothetical protein n=1 Tax=Trichinella spiralis TaxID=6334 RepID=UPI0001EFB449|nr:conserved hypothetical protein [Trichinella spiralis]
MQIETDQPNVVDDQPVATATTTTNQPPGETPVRQFGATVSTTAEVDRLSRHRLVKSRYSAQRGRLPDRRHNSDHVGHHCAAQSEAERIRVRSRSVHGYWFDFLPAVLVVAKKESRQAFPRICRSHTLVCQPLKTVIEPQITASPSINSFMQIKYSLAIAVAQGFPLLSGGKFN